MGAAYQLLFNGQAADAGMYTDVISVEVEEGLDLPGAVQLSLPVAATPSGDMSYISDARLQPFSNLAVVVTPPTSSTSNGLSGILGGSSGASGTSYGVRVLEALRAAVLAGEESGIAEGDVFGEIRDRVRARALATGRA